MQLCTGGQAGTEIILLLQSNRSLTRKIEKLESLFEDGWEDARPRVVQSRISQLTLPMEYSGSTRKIRRCRR